MRNPLIPMGAITGNPTKQQIEEMMQLYCEQGLQQFLIYPRSGCEIEFMSDRWIELCRDIIEFAARKNMHIWLYDEMNWPSGSCAGKVIEENPEFCSKGISVENGVCVLKEFKTYTDILNQDAVDCFIKNTHEVYYKNFSEYFGPVIKGMFTDEPDISYSSGVYGDAQYPYTKNVEKIYEERYGRDLFKDMAQDEPSEHFKQDYWKLLGELYRKNYVGKINDWCVSHNIVLTGHTNDEHIIEKGIKSSGGTITALREFSLPAVDDIFNNTSIDTAQWLCFGCAEAAIRNSKNGGLAELFAIAPTDVVPARIEQVLWLVSMFKINHYLMAVAACDIRGNYEKNRWFNPMNYTSPWFPGYRDLSESAITAATLAEKDILTQVYVRYPKTVAISTFYTQKEGTIDERLSAVLKALIREQYQWQLLDEDEEVPQKKIPVIEITDAEDFSVEEIIKNLKEKVTKGLYVLENGKLADELFVRKFTDGTTVILDLNDNSETRNLVLCDEEEEVHIELLGRGHYIVEDTQKDEYEEICKIKSEFLLELSHKNTIRCNLHPGNMEYTFTVDEEIGNVSLAIRNYRYNGEIFLDDCKVIPCKECDAFTKGINELYSYTDSFTLNPGVHTIRTSVASESEMYLPTCFICGEFSADDNDTLRKLPNKILPNESCRSILPQYVGSICFEADVEIPGQECGIEFDSSDLYTRVYVNDDYMGGRISEYRWNIPDKYWGKNVRLKIEQYTTIAPMFGRMMEAINTEGIDLKWLETKINRQKLGIGNMRFVRKCK